MWTGGCCRNITIKYEKSSFIQHYILKYNKSNRLTFYKKSPVLVVLKTVNQDAAILETD